MKIVNKTLLALGAVLFAGSVHAVTYEVNGYIAHGSVGSADTPVKVTVTYDEKSPFGYYSDYVEWAQYQITVPSIDIKVVSNGTVLFQNCNPSNPQYDPAIYPPIEYHGYFNSWLNWGIAETYGVMHHESINQLIICDANGFSGPAFMSVLYYEETLTEQMMFDGNVLDWTKANDGNIHVSTTGDWVDIRITSVTKVSDSGDLEQRVMTLETTVSEQQKQIQWLYQWLGVPPMPTH